VWALYPLWIVFVVMATANHYLFDVVLGALSALLSALVVDRWLAWRESVRGQGHLGRQPHLR
jgi:PAP2 superfamily protein